MLSYHEKTGLKEIDHEPHPPARVGTYIAERRGYYSKYSWKLRVKRRTKGSTWKQVSQDELPKQLRLEALIFGIQL